MIYRMTWLRVRGLRRAAHLQHRSLQVGLEIVGVLEAAADPQKPRRDDDDNPPSEALHQRVADLEAMLHALKGELAATMVQSAGARKA